MQKKNLHVLKLIIQKNITGIRYTSHLKYISLTANEGILTENDSTCSRGQNHVSILRPSGSKNPSCASARDTREMRRSAKSNFSI